MPNLVKQQLLDELEQRFGQLRKLAGSQSLFSLSSDAARIYFRYSKIHGRGDAFFGLRDTDLRELEGRNSFICFLTDDGSSPLFVPFADFEEVFHSSEPANDGQYKVQLLSGEGTRELYIPRVGRFNMDGYVGLDTVAHRLQPPGFQPLPSLSHCQVQTLIAAIGHRKGFDVFVPSSDCGALDWELTSRFDLRADIPSGFHEVQSVISEIDVIWMERGRDTIEGLFEVEQSGWLGASGNKKRRRARRITLLRPGQEEIAIMTDLMDPRAYPPEELLDAYLARWGIEQVFQQVTEVFSLNHLIGTTPKATIFQAAFCFVLYNVTQLIKTHIADAAQKELQQISTRKLFDDLCEQLSGCCALARGTDIVKVLHHRCPGDTSANRLRKRLRRLLANVWTDWWIKAPTRPRPPTVSPKRYAPSGRASVHRVLEEYQIQHKLA